MIDDNYVPQPKDAGGMENKEGYNWGYLKKQPIFPEILQLIKNPTLKKWADECNRRNWNNPLKINRENPDFDSLRVGPKIKLPKINKTSIEKMKNKLMESCPDAVMNKCVNRNMVRNIITYPHVRQEIGKLIGMTENEAGNAIGNQLCCAIHEDKRGYAILVPNWAHKEFKHSGYASSVVDAINKEDDIPAKSPSKEEPRKRSRKYLYIIGIILLIILLLLLLRNCGGDDSLVEKPIENNVSENVQLPWKFDWEKAVIVTIPITQASPITTVNELHDAVEKSLQEATNLHSDTLKIPIILSKFNFNAYDMSDSSNSLVKAVSELYKQTSGKQSIRIDGYGCNIGDNPANDYISSNRAKMIKDAFADEGISQEHLFVNSYGKRRNNEFKGSDNADLRRVLISFEE